MAEITWTGGKHGLWSTKADWSGQLVPGATDVAVLGAGDIVTIASPAAAADIALNGADLVVQSTLAVTGTVASGIVDATNGTVDFGVGATLDALTWHGPLDIANGDTVDVEGGLAVKGAGGIGTIDLQTQSAWSQLIVLDGETWNNSLVTGNGLILVHASKPGTVFTLAAGETVTSQAGNGYIDFSGYNSANNITAGIVNHGSLIDDNLMGFDFGTFTNAGTLAIGAGATASLFDEGFSNTGLIEASSGTGLFTTWYYGHLGGDNVTNYTTAGGGTLAGGTWEADTGATLDLQLAGSIATDTATLVLNGPSCEIAAYNATTGTYQSLADTVTSLGSLLLLGSDWASPQSLAVTGTVEMMGGTLSAAPLHLTRAAARIVGSGTVASTGGIALTTGKIEADYGTLTVAANVTGKGALQVDAGATLALSGAASQTVTFVGISTLQLDQPPQFTGALAAVSAGDALVLDATQATSVDLAGGKLTIDLAGGKVETYAVTGSATSASFTFTAATDTTLVTFGTHAATQAFWPAHTG